MLIKRYKSVLNKEYFDISEIGMDGILEGLSRKDLMSLIDNICNTFTNDELLEANRITDWHLFQRTADTYAKEAISESPDTTKEGTEAV